MRESSKRVLATLFVASIVLASCGVDDGDDTFPVDAGVLGQDLQRVNPKFDRPGDAGIGNPVEGGIAASQSQDEPARYPRQTYSPITPFVAANLRAIAARAWKNDRAFSKIGDSVTVSTSFMRCFAGGAVNWGHQGELEATRRHFDVPLVVDGQSPYARTSLCATVGWPAFMALAGSPAALDREIAAVAPRFALLMYGSNDIGWDNIDGYANDMLDIVDKLISGGTVPLMSTIMPRDDRASADAQVPLYNAVVRAIAQARQVPLMDFHRELVGLPDHGLGGDNVHPSTDPRGACVLTGSGLTFGYNVRNLLALRTLDRAKRVVVDDEPAPDRSAPSLAGRGTVVDPFVIDSLPFVDARDTRESASRAIDAYPGCGATQNEAGPEVVYRLRLDSAKTVRINVFDRGQVDIDVHLLGSSISGASCLRRHDRELMVYLQPGTYHLVLDTYVNVAGERAGEYLLTVLAQ